MSTLTAIWSQVDALLNDGLSLIPVRDKNEVSSNGDTYLAKTPYRLWKEFQTRQVNRDELWAQMDQRNTTAVAIVCGKISGNLETIDVDVKYKPGIDAIILADIRTFYPDLFARMRVHKTPSSGLHIPYRVTGHDVPGNLKLAGRLASDDEIQLQINRGIKRPNKEVNFLETRGEGGYILAPPSLGYSVLYDNPIPTITWEERCALIRICESYNELIKEAPKPSLSKSQESIYSENPFEHYNNDVNPIDLMADFGWKFSKQNKFFIWFTRPDKDKGVSASWNIEKRMFFVFTSSTELQSNRGYHPATLLAELKFKGNKSDTYHHLVKQGFGKVKPAVEKSIVRKAAATGKPLPPNFSEQAKIEYTATTEQLKENYPFGVFIKYDAEEEKQTVSREALLYVSRNLGFRYYDGDLVQIEGHVIRFVTEREFQDALKDYIREEDPEVYEELCNIYEAFMQKNGKYTAQRLQLLDESKLLYDTRDTCYKFYNNGYVTITTDSIEFRDYNTFNYLVWSDKIQPRNYVAGSGGRFMEYLKLAVLDVEQAQKIYGFLSHEYKDETTGYIIVLTEQCPDPKQGGGSGKNVFCNLLRLTTTYTSKPGAQAKFDEKFFQSWNRQRVFGISDVPKNFDFAFLKEPSTGSFIWKKLFKDEVEVESKDAPKFVVQTNFSYEISDGGLKRRIIPLEFTGFFTAAGGLDVHFGVHFPNGWTESDYAGFDDFVATSIQKWMQAGLKLHATELTETGWMKQWEQTYGNATGFILENWDHWVQEQFVTNETFKRELERYCNENNIIKNYWPSSSKLNAAITAYGEKHGVGFKKDVPKRFENGIFKCRSFYKGTEPVGDSFEDDKPPF